MKRTLYLLFAALHEQWRSEKAYVGNFWFEMISKLAYNFVYLIFIDQIFRRVGSIGGYSHNDYLCMYLIAQLGFYICYYGIFNAMVRLVDVVRTGGLDLLLLKPVPHRAFIYVGSIRPIETLATCVPMLLILTTQINFGELHMSIASAALAIVIALGGIIICNTLMFVLALPVFKTGEATDTINVFYSITSMSQVPYSKLPVAVKVLSLVVLPQLIVTGATTQVLLMKNDVAVTVALVVAAAGVSLILLRFAWRHALRNYTSASS